MWGAISLTVYTFGALPLSLAALILYKKLTKPARKPIQKTDWKKDMVYIYQIPLVPKVRTISPLALKLETWLRVNKIAYENIETMTFSKKGQMPYIEFNGEEIPDSNVIIATMKKYFDVDPDKVYSLRDKSIAHAVVSMVENHTAITGFHYRYGLHMGEFLDFLQMYDFYPNAKLWGMVQPMLTKFRSYLTGIGRHELPEIWEFARQDLLAISEILGDKPFLLGESPSTADCTLFGHLAQFLYIEIGFPQREVLVTECQNLVSLVERIKELYWPDWEQQMPKIKQKAV